MKGTKNEKYELTGWFYLGCHEIGVCYIRIKRKSELSRYELTGVDCGWE